MASDLNFTVNRCSHVTEVTVDKSIDLAAYSVSRLGTLLSAKITSEVCGVSATSKPTEHERNFR